MRYFKKQADIYDDIIHNKFFKWVDKNVDYAGSLIRHKWNVYDAARDLKVPLGRRITHDMNKFDPLVFTTYRDYFAGGRRDPKFMKQIRAAKDLHKATSRHHSTGPDSPTDVAMEAVADWYSAEKRQRDYPSKFPDLRTWIIKRQEPLLKHFGQKHFETALVRASGF